MSLSSRLREPATFYGVGLLNTAIDFFAFALLSRALGVPYLVAQFLAYTTGAANSYALNRVVTFRREGPWPWREAGRFALANALSLVTASLLLVGLHQGLGVGLLAAKALSLVVSAALNYLMSRFWVFPPAGGSQAAGGAAPTPAWGRASGGGR